MKRLILVTGTIITMLVITGFSSHGDDGVVIHGCYERNNGILRIVGGPSECRPSEEPIFWNQTGPPGPQGAKGETGTQGPPGIGCLGVYNGSGLFLGHLVDYAGEYFSYKVLRVFNSDIPGMFSISPVTRIGDNVLPIPHFREIWDLTYLSFTSEDCSTQAYVEGDPLGIFVNRYADPYEYFIVDTTISPVSTGELMSRIPLEGGPCESGNWGSTGLALPIQSISFPFADLDLEYPIVVRPIE